MEGKKITKLIMDIGNAKVKLLVGETTADFQKMQVSQYVEVPTKGMRKSEVESSELLAESIQEALKQLDAPDLKTVSIGLGGKAIQSRTQKVHIDFPEKTVEAEDLENLYREAEKILSEEDRVLRREMYNIRVSSSQTTIKDPVGLLSESLEANVHLIFVNQADIEKLMDAIHLAGLEVEDIYLNVEASMRATLIDPDYTKQGVSLIDIGEGSTDIIIVTNDKIIYTKSQNIGGMHFISDIMYLSHVEEEEAKEVFQVYMEGDMPEEYVSKISGKTYTKKNIEEIIDARIGDIATFILNIIHESGFTGYLSKGLVLTGGVANLDRLSGKITAQTGGMVRRKKPYSIKGMEDPGYSSATSLGLLLLTMEKEMRLAEEEKARAAAAVLEEEGDELQELLDSKEEETEGIGAKVKKWLGYFL